MRHHLDLLCWCDVVETPGKGSSQVASPKKRKMKASPMCAFTAIQVTEAEKGKLFVFFVIFNCLKNIYHKSNIQSFQQTSFSKRQ